MKTLELIDMYIDPDYRKGKPDWEFDLNKMTNLFRDILNDLPKVKIEIIPNDQKDKEISKQFESLINWKIVKSRSDKHPECGYPMGQVLCRSQDEANDHIQKSEFNDCYIEEYKTI
jgi:hypothetical protein